MGDARGCNFLMAWSRRAVGALFCSFGVELAMIAMFFCSSFSLQVDYTRQSQPGVFLFWMSCDVVFQYHHDLEIPIEVESFFREIFF
jgi:hypothetical protein